MKGWKRSLASAATGFCLVLTATPALATATPTLWLSPLQPVIRKDGAQGGATDYFALFDPPAPWRTVSGRIAVFKIYPELLHTASDAQMRAIFADLRSRHIALALETPILSAVVTCGSARDLPWPRLVHRLKHLQADLRFIAMVGPATAGRRSAHDVECPQSMDQIAEDAEHTIRMMQADYPDVAFGEIESVGNGDRSPTPDDIVAWLRAYRRHDGPPIGFLHADVTWNGLWQAPMAAIARLCQAAGISFGVIYKGDVDDLSDAAFTSHALREADRVEALLGGPPAQIVFQSWEDYPRRTMPETDPATMTGLVMQYLRPATRLTMLPGDRVRLTGRNGQKLAGEALTVQIHDPGRDSPMRDEAIAGIAPHGAVSARFLLHMDGAGVATDRIELTQPSFNIGGDTEPSGWTRQRLPARPGPDGASQNGTLVTVSGGRLLNLVGPPSTVTGDTPISGRFGLRVPPALAGAGYIAIVFAGPQGTELRRTALKLDTTWHPSSLLRTDIDGVAVLPSSPGRPGILRRVDYSGSQFLRPASLSLDRQ